jgi:hypothetical protein
MARLMLTPLEWLEDNMDETAGKFDGWFDAMREAGRSMADALTADSWQRAWTHVTAAISAPQVGVINHGGGLDVDYAEMEEQMNGYVVKRENGYSALYREPKVAL